MKNSQRSEILINMKRFILLCFVALYALPSLAVPAQPGLRAVKQPDGSTLMVQLIGDEYFHYYATSDGHPLVKNESGAYVYAYMQNDLFVATEMIAHDPSLRKADEQDLVRQLQPVTMPESARQMMQKNNGRRAAFMQKTRGGIGEPGKFIGEKRGLVILVDFPDVRMTHAREEFDAMMNQKDYNLNGSIGSLSDYFYDQSYGQLKIDFDVVGPFTLSNTLDYYGKNCKEYKDTLIAELVTEAVYQAHEAGTDFSKYDWTGDGNVDQVFLIYAGYAESAGAPDYTIWPKENTLDVFSDYSNIGDGPISLDGVTVNKFACASELYGTEGNEMCGIGTAAHEFSHCLGLPDFYNTKTGISANIGEWSIMDHGCYNKDGYVPSAFTSYERMFCGWLTPEELTTDTRISNMRPITETPEAYIIYNQGTRIEYYLLENHQQQHNSDKYHAWDCSAYGHGMLVLHVVYDKWSWSNNSVNWNILSNQMSVIPANNIFKYTYDSKNNYPAGHPYPGTTGNTALTNISVPNSELYRFNSDGNTLMNAPITEITEDDGCISFCFRIDKEIPVLEEPAEVDATSFVARWQKIDDVFSYTLEVTDLLPAPATEDGPDNIGVDPVKTYKSIEATSFPLTDLRSGGHYSYRVMAETIYFGSTEWSEPKEVKLSDPSSIISTLHSESRPASLTYDLFGNEVSEGYHGIVICKGKKFIQE